MISAQKKTAFEYSKYNKIKKVYSIWICTNATKDWRNAIDKYSIAENSIVGKAKADAERYDLMTTVIIGIGNEKNPNYNGIVKMLDTLLSIDKKVDEKIDILNNEFDIVMTTSMKGKVNKMCNLSQGVYDKAYNDAYSEATERGIKTLIKNELCHNSSDEEIIECVQEDYDVSRKEIVRYIENVREMLLAKMK